MQEQESAATRIAMAHCSKQARAILSSKREHQRLVDEAEADRVLMERAAKREAATKLQAVQRSRQARAHVAELLKQRRIDDEAEADRVLAGGVGFHP